MLKSYFTMAWRSLIKNKVSSFINIGGLAVGLATGIIIMLVVMEELSFDKFNTHLADTYMLMTSQKQSGEISVGRASSGIMAPAMRAEMPEVKYAARVCDVSGQMIRVGNKTTFESGIYAEPDFFNIMSFPAVAGNPVAALREPGSVVLTEHIAKKLFGNDNPIGKIIVHNNKHALKVAAVVRDVPSNSSIGFDMVFPFQLYEQENPWIDKWDYNSIVTWMQLQPSADPLTVNKKLTHLLRARATDTLETLFAFPLARLRLHGEFKNGQSSGGRIYMVWLLSLIGIFMLLIACINFMNLATAHSEHRAREVGVRKALGASRKWIIVQFFSEALLMTFIALALGVLIAKLLLPAFNQVTEKNIQFDFGNGQLWFSLLGIGLFTGLVAGSYPALFLSRFKTVKVLKGVNSTGKGGRLRRVLVTAQFFISIFFIIGTVVVYMQINHVRDRPIGYDQDNLVQVAADGELAGRFEVFKNELSGIPGVKDVSAGTDDILQYGSSITGMDWPGKEPGNEVTLLVSGVQYNWIKTTGLQLMEGRDFSPTFGTDTAACIVNEAAVRRLGLKAPVLGQQLGGKAIIGVFRDFVFNNPSGIIAPMRVTLDTGRLDHFFVRIQNDGHWRATLAGIGAVAKKLNPDYPSDVMFVKEGYQRRFEEFASFGMLASLFGGMAIFISCLGLFGLSAFMAEKRSKEMSIRKVLGASAANVWLSLSKDFLKPVFIAFLLVVPLAIWVLHALLSDIAYHIELSWWMFAVAGSLTVVIALLTVSYQGVRTALENPATKLRNE
jgi:putative ABC transport system permease protein